MAKKRLLFCQPRRHVDFVGINGEMHQRAILELEQRRAWVAVFAILFNRMPPILAGARVL
jgi:hypothetical protein